MTPMIRGTIKIEVQFKQGVRRSIETSKQSTLKEFSNKVRYAFSIEGNELLSFRDQEKDITYDSYDENALLEDLMWNENTKLVAADAKDGS
mmetsp:Transcript_129279/g.192548  ORF Transcript_129279/g.192548 Transcript_129279/m.192548 type:complete len:91 (-) Transcript_129279:51-323(-)